MQLLGDDGGKSTDLYKQESLQILSALYEQYIDRDSL